MGASVILYASTIVIKGLRLNVVSFVLLLRQTLFSFRSVFSVAAVIVATVIAFRKTAMPTDHRHARSILLSVPKRRGPTTLKDIRLI